eukprot:999548-Rhodomonas_salina.2
MSKVHSMQAILREEGREKGGGGREGRGPAPAVRVQRTLPQAALPPPLPSAPRGLQREERLPAAVIARAVRALSAGVTINGCPK